MNRTRVAPPVTAGPPTWIVRQGAGQSLDGVVVERAELLRRAPPVGDVRLVPQLPVPAGHFLRAVALDAVRGELEHQLLPHLWLSLGGGAHWYASYGPYCEGCG